MTEPLTSPDCDCTDLDGFMLNVERLMASELVALSSHEVVAAALFLWCRAWKQRPAASLPDDDRVNAAFARLPLARYRKLKPDILRGFVKCTDGRLYHRVLADEASHAFDRKQAFRRKREGDAERLRKWRTSNNETHHETRFTTQNETHVETPTETRFVAEGQGQGQGQGQVDKKEKDEAIASSKKRGSRLPEGWAPNEADRVFASNLGLDPDRIAPKFRDYWHSKPGQQAVKLDWSKTWANWCRTEAERTPRQNSLTAIAAPDDGLTPDERRWRARWRDFHRVGFWLDEWGPKPGEQGCQVPQIARAT